MTTSPLQTSEANGNSPCPPAVLDSSTQRSIIFRSISLTIGRSIGPPVIAGSGINFHGSAQDADAGDHHCANLFKRSFALGCAPLRGLGRFLVRERRATNWREWVR